MTLRNTPKRSEKTNIADFPGIEGAITPTWKVADLKTAVEKKNLHQRDEAVEDISVGAVIRYLDWLGWDWRDRGMDNIGYDVEAIHPETGEKIGIEVKGVYAPNKDSKVRVLRNELKFLQNTEGTHKPLLALVTVAEDGSTKIHLCQNPPLGGTLGPEAYRPYPLREVLLHSELTTLPPTLAASQIPIDELPSSQLETLEDLRFLIENASPEQLKTIMDYINDNAKQGEQE